MSEMTLKTLCLLYVTPTPWSHSRQAYTHLQSPLGCHSLHGEVVEVLILTHGVFQHRITFERLLCFLSIIATSRIQLSTSMMIRLNNNQKANLCQIFERELISLTQAHACCYDLHSYAVAQLLFNCTTCNLAHVVS
jgi:hypothetical protein